MRDADAAAFAVGRLERLRDELGELGLVDAEVDAELHAPDTIRFFEDPTAGVVARERRDLPRLAMGGDDDARPTAGPRSAVCGRP